MRRHTFALLFLAGSAAPLWAQPEVDYVRPERRWSAAVDFVGPLFPLFRPGEQRLRLDGALQHWYKQNRAWRVGLSHTNERYGDDQGPLEFNDGLFTRRVGKESFASTILRAGVLAQDREPRISGIVGVSVLVGIEQAGLEQTELRYLPDTLPCAPCALTALEPREGLRLEDRFLIAGIEAVVGGSYRIGQRLELEFRLPLQLRSRSLISRQEEGGVQRPGGWDAPLRFGVPFPGLFLHYRW